MELELLGEEFAVCSLTDLSQVDFSQKCLFLAVTDKEISLVCQWDNLPSNAEKWEGPFSAFRFKETLDFSLVGVLSKISLVLAEEGISIFAISTYNTDYILVKAQKLMDAERVLEENGYFIVHLKT